MIKPNCIILGAAKSGTTFLFNLLKQHPDICVPLSKEITFFTDNRHFDKAERFIKKEYKNYINEKIILDNTPQYLLESSCAKRMYDFSGPDTKLVCILRNPVNRAFSHYIMLKLQSQYDKPFSYVIRDEINGGKKTKPTYRPFKRVESVIVRRGLYYESIMDFLEFFNRSNLHIIIFEDFIKDTENEMKKLLRFMEVNDEFSFNYNVNKNSRINYSPSLVSRWAAVLFHTLKKCGFKVTNKQRYKWFQLLSKKMEEKPIISSEDRELLLEYYKESINNLEKEFKLNLSHWKV
jgi:hypothetical protein